MFTVNIYTQIRKSDAL